MKSTKNRIRLTFGTAIALVILSFSLNTQAQSSGTHGTECPGASFSALAIQAILDSDKLAKAYPDFSTYISSYINSISRVPEKVGVYLVTTSLSDGSAEMKLEVTVSGAEACTPGKALVTSVVRK